MWCNVILLDFIFVILAFKYNIPIKLVILLIVLFKTNTIHTWCKCNVILLDLTVSIPSSKSKILAI